MDLGEGEITAKLEPTPDGWGRVVEVDAHRDRLAGRWRRTPQVRASCSRGGDGCGTPQLIDHGGKVIGFEPRDDLAEEGQIWIVGSGF
ncbi:hypothetical protein GCM10009590_18490 [Brachybacterium alimentarium]